MFWNLVNRLWSNRRVLFGSLSVLFSAIIVIRTTNNSPDYRICTNIVPIDSNTPSYSNIQFTLFNSHTADQNIFTNTCINLLANPGDVVLLDSIPRGTKVSCESYNLPSDLNCEGWDAVSYIESLWADPITDEQMLLVNIFKSQWQRRQNVHISDQLLQLLIDNNLDNSSAQSKAKIDSPLVFDKFTNENQIAGLKAIQKLRQHGESYEDIFAYYEKGKRQSKSISADRAYSLIKTLEEKRNRPYGQVFFHAKAVLVDVEGAEILRDYLDTIPEHENRYAILGPG